MSIKINGEKITMRGTATFRCAKCGEFHSVGVKYPSNNTYNYMCECCAKELATDGGNSSNIVNSKPKTNGLYITCNVILLNASINASFKAIDNGYSIEVVNGRKHIVGGCFGWSSISALMRELNKCGYNYTATFNITDLATDETAYNVPLEHKDLFVHGKWKVARYNKIYR